MDILSYPILLGALAVLIALHIVSVILHGMGAKLVSYLNIVLHVAYLFPLAYYKINIEEAVLCYLVSVFSYTLAATVHHYVISRRAAAVAAEVEATEPEATESETVEPESNEPEATVNESLEPAKTETVPTEEEKGGDAE